MKGHIREGSGWETQGPPEMLTVNLERAKDGGVPDVLTRNQGRASDENTVYPDTTRFMRSYLVVVSVQLVCCAQELKPPPTGTVLLPLQPMLYSYKT